MPCYRCILSMEPGTVIIAVPNLTSGDGRMFWISEDESKHVARWDTSTCTYGRHAMRPGVALALA